MRVIGMAMVALAGCSPITDSEPYGGIPGYGACDSPPRAVAGISISPSPITLKPNSSVSVQVFPMDANGPTTFCGPTPNLVIRDHAVATMASNPNALHVIVQGVAVGSTYAVATAGGRSDSVPVFVTVP